MQPILCIEWRANINNVFKSMSTDFSLMQAAYFVKE